MAASRRPSRRPVSRRSLPARQPQSLPEQIGLLAVWLTLLVPPFLFSIGGAKEVFRLPKLMASESLALASLFFLAWRVRRAGEVSLAGLWRLPAVRALAPLLLIATLSLATTSHPLHAREGLIDLWIGAAALVGWSVALPERRQEGLLCGFLWPATFLAFLGILQYYGLFQPFELAGIAYDKRLGVTSTAGNPGDLGAYLVLPCLAAQWMLVRGARGKRALVPLAALAVCLYSLALTQTLAALAALAVGSLILWVSVLPGRRAAMLLGGGAALALVLVLAVAPLRTRMAAKASQALQGDWNSVLTGRLDGWRAAVWMLREHPWAGVGQGAFRPEFVPAKLALLDRGVRFYADQLQPVFANAHNEYLEAGADWGIPGLLALAWALWTLFTALRGRPPRTAAFAAAGAAALAILALAHFPFRIALVGYPALLFLAWVLRPDSGDGEGEDGGGRADGRDGGARGGVKGSLLVWPLAAVLALALTGQAVRGHARLTAGRLLARVEALTLAATSQGSASRGLLRDNLDALHRAADLDPVEVGVPIARGSQYLVFGSPEAAIESYAAAAALEPRPEIYLNLGRADLFARRPEEARHNFSLALRLDPHLAPVVPPEMR